MIGLRRRTNARFFPRGEAGIKSAPGPFLPFFEAVARLQHATLQPARMPKAHARAARATLDEGSFQ